ncbi:MAG: TonB-dependent receptor [Tannerella sp.]|nr:TonB-dependent receptor [Tannerella sp.]
MRISVFLLLMCGTVMAAENAYSQKARVSIRQNNVPLETVLIEIENQTDYLFLYNSEQIDATRNVSLNVKNQQVKDVLATLFSDEPVNAVMEGTHIVLQVDNKPIMSEITFVAQQTITITGIVTDNNGETLPGVNVLIKGTTIGVITDAGGHYSINVPNENVVLSFSYIGFISQDIAVGNSRNINVNLIEDIQAMDEVVVVGYGTQRKSTLTGSVSSIKSEQIAVSPVGNITNSLTGKLPGLITIQSSGLPGSDQAALNIRGYGTPLVIVDGIEASLTNLDPNQIENVSILKDGASSIYGARAGNGVVLITTKRGISQKPTITLNTSYTMQGVTNMAKTLSSGQWAELSREQHLNSGQPEETAPYTLEQISKYYAGNDPEYPSSDWYDFTFRDWAPQQNYNLSIRGGNEKLKYMGYFGYQKQETMIKKNGGDYQRFNILSNIDATITDHLHLGVDLMAAYEFKKFAGRGLGNQDGVTWQDLYATKPWFPTTLPDPKRNAAGGADVGSVALSTNMDVWGYNNSKPRELRGTITLTYDVPFVEGLQAKAFVNYLDLQTMNKWFQKPYQWYTYNAAADVYVLAGSLWTAAQSNESIEVSRRITQQYSLNYDREFASHHLTVLALVESIDYAGNYFSAGRRDFLTPDIEQLFAGSASSQTNNGSANEAGRASFIGRINYSFKDKYLLETILRADASSKFIKEKRWGYFPSISLGWVISSESFMENVKALDFLKLRASYGSSGYDNVGDFKYITGYQISGLYQWGNNFTSGLQSTGLANPNLTWEIMKVYNGGLDFSILNRKIYGSLEGFYRTRTGIPATRVISYPSTFGASLPTENLNSLNNRGFELSLGTVKNTGDFTYDISANISWSRAKWDHYDEPEFTDPDQKRQNQRSGQWTDRTFGYISNKLFTSMNEINSLPYRYAELGEGNTNLRPGDVIYLDTNGDGLLDWKDQVEIGNGNEPHWFYGLNGAFAYKGFDLVTLFQGAFGYSASSRHVFNTSYTFEERWTESKNDPDALIPRPGGSGSNGWTSDYWIKSAFYLRLKNIALGYSIPKQWVEKAGIEKIRFYVAGTNLFTISTLSKYYIDPEAPTGTADRYYPQQRTISIGLNMDF